MESIKTQRTSLPVYVLSEIFSFIPERELLKYRRMSKRSKAVVANSWKLQLYQTEIMQQIVQETIFNSLSPEEKKQHKGMKDKETQLHANIRIQAQNANTPSLLYPDIKALSHLVKPHPIVYNVIRMVWTVFGNVEPKHTQGKPLESVIWSSCKKMLKDKNFHQSLVEFDINKVNQKIVDKLNQIINSYQYMQLQWIIPESTQCVGMFLWCQELMSYYNLMTKLRKVKPEILLQRSNALEKRFLKNKTIYQKFLINDEKP